MKSLTEIYTPLIKNLVALNQEIRQKLSYMPSYTELEMQSLERWLAEAESMAKDLENHSLIIYHHLKLLQTAYNSKRKQDMSEGLTDVS